MRDLDYIGEKLRGAASDCHVHFEPDQVRYITKVVVAALAAIDLRNKHPAYSLAEATMKELHEAMIPMRHTDGWDEPTQNCEHVFDTSMNDHTRRCCKCGMSSKNPSPSEERIKRKLEMHKLRTKTTEME